MKKIVLGLSLIKVIVFANTLECPKNAEKVTEAGIVKCKKIEQNILDLETDYKNTKEMMIYAKKHLPVIYSVITDYFQAKTCKDDFTDIISKEEIRDFAASYQYGVLIGLKYNEDKAMSKATYLALNNAFKAMNCGNENSFSGFIGATSAFAVELDSRNKTAK